MMISLFQGSELHLPSLENKFDTTQSLAYILVFVHIESTVG